MPTGKPHVKKDKRKRRRCDRAKTPTLAIKGAKGNPMTGHEARLEAFVKRALELKRLNYYHHQVAEKIAEEFKLEVVPAITTVADWLKKGSEAVRRDIEELQWQMRIEQFKELDRLKAKWMPLATANALEIQRWVIVEGELQPSMDENAIKEQVDATKAVVAIMNRQAKLLGLDMEKAVTPTGEGPGSLQDLQIWLVNQINMTTGAPNGSASIDVHSEVLELSAGIPELADAV